jgi:phosphoglycolate phosphatase-like HAD superfamily hydrolase
LSRVLLFDIDQTLLYTGGAGALAFNRAFEEIFGITDGFGKVEFSGRTDLYILAEGLRQGGIPGDVRDYLDTFLPRYYAFLPEALKEKAGYLMPGFPEMLQTLSQDDVVIGLGTGNFTGAAQLKLEHYGIAGYFSGGGFGEHSLERADVIRAAIGDLADGASPQEVLVIGDTPKDVEAALANGVTAVGVATGSYTTEQLHAAGAHITFEDFSDWKTAAALLAP